MENDKHLYKRIVNKEIEVKSIYESNNVIAFYHPYPKYDKHIVIIPKKYIKDFADLKTEDELIVWDIIKVAKYIAKGLVRSGYGVRFFTDMGEFQEYDYLSFYLIADEQDKKY